MDFDQTMICPGQRAIGGDGVGEGKKVSDMIATIYFDGAYGSNPKKSTACAIILMDHGERNIFTRSLKKCTSNEAEYLALIFAFQKVLELGLREVWVYGDSQLVVNQVNGLWRVQAPRLRGLCVQARSLVAQFKKCTLEWIPRHENQAQKVIT